MTGSTIIYYALVALLVGVGAGVAGLYGMFAAERRARQAHDAWAADVSRRRRAAERAKRALSLEHELGILGHECGPECPPPDEPTALYRLFLQDAQIGEAPLYIGLSADGAMCRQDHWPWPETRVEVEWFPSREKANAARLRAILDERPRWTA